MGDYGPITWYAIAVTAVCIVVAFSLLVEADKYMVSPEFYAIGFILMQIMAGG